MKKLLAILMVLALACGCAFAEETEEDALSAATVQIREMPVIETQDNGILVVFFSPDVTTRAAAYAVAAGLNAELFEIIPEELYTEEDLDYTNNFSRSEKEQRDKTARPAISRLPEDLTKYDTIFLGYPIWNAMAPKILYTFVESVDLSGKISSSAGTIMSRIFPERPLFPSAHRDPPPSAAARRIFRN